MRRQLIRRNGPERVAHMIEIDCLVGAIPILTELASNAFADDPVPSLQGVPREELRAGFGELERLALIRVPTNRMLNVPAEPLGGQDGCPDWATDLLPAGGFAREAPLPCSRQLVEWDRSCLAG